MKTTSAAFTRAFLASPADWKRGDLTPLSALELATLTRLMGVPHTGTRAALLDRLLTAASARDVLSIYPADHAGAVQLAGHFKRPELVTLARSVGAFYSLPKVGIAVSLLNWREDCRRRGQTFLRDWKAETKTVPRQMRLRFED